MPNSELVNSVVKALDILQFVSARPEGVRLMEVAEAFNLKRPTAYNLVRTLRAYHFLEQDAGRKLRLGPAPGELIAAQRQGSFLANAERELPKLAKRFPGAVFTLCELAGNEIFCRLRVSPDRPGQIQHPISFTFSPYGTVTGVCMQAFGQFDEIGFERKYPFTEFGAPLWGSRERFLLKLEAHRKEGHVARCEEGAELYAAIPAGERYSLGFHGVIPAGMTMQEVIDKLKQAVALIAGAKAES